MSPNDALVADAPLYAAWGAESGATVHSEAAKVLALIRGASSSVYEFSHDLNIEQLALSRRDLVELLRQVRAAAPDTQCYATPTPHKDVVGSATKVVRAPIGSYTVYVERVPPARARTLDEIVVRDAYLLGEKPPRDVLEQRTPALAEAEKARAKWTFVYVALILVLLVLWARDRWETLVWLFTDYTFLAVFSMCMVCLASMGMMVGSLWMRARSSRTRHLAQNFANPMLVAWAHDALRALDEDKTA